MSPCKALSCAFYRVSEKFKGKSPYTVVNFVPLLLDTFSHQQYHVFLAFAQHVPVGSSLFETPVEAGSAALHVFIRYLFNFSLKGYISYASSITARTV